MPSPAILCDCCSRAQCTHAHAPSSLPSLSVGSWEVTVPFPPPPPPLPALQLLRSSLLTCLEWLFLTLAHHHRFAQKCPTGLLDHPKRRPVAPIRSAPSRTPLRRILTPQMGRQHRHVQASWPAPAAWPQQLRWPIFIPSALGTPPIRLQPPPVPAVAPIHTFRTPNRRLWFPSVPTIARSGLGPAA